MTLSPNHGFSMEEPSYQITPVESFIERKTLMGKTLDERIAMFGCSSFLCNLGKKTRIYEGYLVYDGIEIVVTKNEKESSLLITRMKADCLFVMEFLHNNIVKTRHVINQLDIPICIDADVIRVTQVTPECSPVIERNPHILNEWKLISHPGIQSVEPTKMAYHPHSHYFACITCNECFSSLKQLADHYDMPAIFDLDKFKQFDPITGIWSKIKIHMHANYTNIERDMNSVFRDTILDKVYAYYQTVLQCTPERIDTLYQNKSDAPDEMYELFTF